MKKVWESFHRYMIRPVIYQAFTRAVYTLLIVLLLHRFAGARLNVLFTAAFAVYVLLSWVAWLRLDGAKLPDLDHKLFRRKKFRKPQSYGDMADYLDQNPISFEELEQDERDICLLLANLAVALLSLLVSFFF